MRTLLFVSSVCILAACLQQNASCQIPEGKHRVATVLGKEIYLDNVTPANAEAKRKKLDEIEYRKWLLNYRANLLLSRVIGPVMKDYRAKADLKPTDEEILEEINKVAAEFKDHLQKKDLKEVGIGRRWLYGSARDWRTAKALYEKHGGRVGISSFGACTAIDGLNVVLKEYEDAGKLTFHDADIEAVYRKKVTSNPNTDVVLRPERVKQHFATAPWQRRRNQLMKEVAEAAVKTEETPVESKDAAEQAKEGEQDLSAEQRPSFEKE